MTKDGVDNGSAVAATVQIAWAIATSACVRRNQRWLARGVEKWSFARRGWMEGEGAQTVELDDVSRLKPSLGFYLNNRNLLL